MKFEPIISYLEKHQPGRPAYVYDLDGIRHRLGFMRQALGSFYRIHYAVKANHHPWILKTLASEGVGADVVSGGEFEACVRAGFAPQQIVFSGVGKSKEELKVTLKSGVGQINIESEPELQRIIRLKAELGLTQSPRISLRVNPDVQIDTHPYIRTGLLENKFGLDFQTAKQIAQKNEYNSRVDFVGLSLHIGSQIRDTAPFVESVKKTLSLFSELQAFCPSLATIDIGGGIGINYENGEPGDGFSEDKIFFDQYVRSIKALLDPMLQSGKIKSVLLEPGRFLVARYGYLFAQVEYVKQTKDKKFLILNTGMHHLMRPMLYQAVHRIQVAQPRSTSETRLYDVVGPICESADVLGKNIALPANLNEGDWVMIRDVGAYGSVMKSRYNLQLEPIEIVLSNQGIHI